MRNTICIAIIASLAALAACTISPPRSGLKCPDGRCPAEQSCVEGVCETQVPRDSGTSSSRDGGKPDAGEDSGPPAPTKMCGDGCSGNTPICSDGVCVECETGTRFCEGDTPVVCDTEHRKQPQPSCSGDAPICNNGVCRDMRLRGGLVVMEPVLRSSTGMRLVEQALTRTAVKCVDIDGRRLCLHGGLEP